MIKVAGVIAAVIVTFSAGWTVNDWQRDALELAVLEAARATADTWKAKETELAREVSKKLRGLRANERIIERQVTKIVDRPIYNIECIDNDGLRIINGDVVPDRRNTRSALRPLDEMDSDHGLADHNTG